MKEAGSSTVGPGGSLFTRRSVSSFYSFQDLKVVPILSKNVIRVSSLSDPPAIQDGVLELFLMIAIENGNARTKVRGIKVPRAGSHSSNDQF